MLWAMKKIVKIVSGILVIPVLGLGGLIAAAIFTDFKPDSVMHVSVNRAAPATNARKIDARKNDGPASGDPQIYNLMIWNIGYAGLGRDMDFFYDGGKQVRPPRPRVEENLSAVQAFLLEDPDIDFFLFQEVDEKSKRSYGINQVSRLSRAFPDFYSSFAKNYDVIFVPVPVLDPLGPVRSGLLTLSRFEPLSVVRHAFPGNYAWPQGLFMLDRCFLVSRFGLANKKELVVINTHNSAYDDGGLRTRQMGYLKEFLIKEVEQGNFLVVGGDWNQCPPGFVPDFASNIMDNTRRMDIDLDYIEQWSWAWDKTIPTNRRLAAPYDAGTSPTTVIDFFLVSPNVEVQEVQGIYLGFEHSDHHPVKLKIKLPAS